MAHSEALSPAPRGADTPSSQLHSDPLTCVMGTKELPQAVTPMSQSTPPPPRPSPFPASLTYFPLGA